MTHSDEIKGKSLQQGCSNNKEAPVSMAGPFNFLSTFMSITGVVADWRATVDEFLAPLSPPLLPVFIILSIPQENTIWNGVLGKFHVSKLLFCDSLSFSCPCWLSGKCATVLWPLDRDCLDCLERWLKCPQLLIPFIVLQKTVGCTQPHEYNWGATWKKK
jgi:hypothetical protein